MSYNGSGVFQINSAGEPAVANTLITAATHNALTADLATGLSTALTKDGQTTPTANIPLGGFKLTGVGAATARTDGATLATIQDGTGVYVATVGGTADAITLTASPAITAYAAGQTFRWIASGANTTAVTVAISGLAAKTVTKNGSTALVAGDIASGAMVTATYDGTRFILGSTNTLVLPLAGGNLTGGINEAKTTVASTTTPDIFAITVGGYIDYTGTVTCTGFAAAPQAGAIRELRCAGAAPFVAGANMLIDGYASGETFTATADDRVIVRAETTTQFRLTIRKRNAKPITPSLPFVVAGGTADAITANFTPDLVLADEPIFALVMGAANATTTPTLAIDGGTARTIVKNGGTALTAGDIPGALAVCLLKYNLANTRFELLNPSSIEREAYICIRDEKASGTEGGTFTSGAWRTRDLNTEVHDAGNYASVGSNQITLAAGTYRFLVVAPANAVDTHKARLYNVSDATTVSVGSSMAARATGPADNTSVVFGRMTIASSKIFEVQHICGATRATDGFGKAGSFGVVEVYTSIELWRE